MESVRRLPVTAGLLLRRRELVRAAATLAVSLIVAGTALAYTVRASTLADHVHQPAVRVAVSSVGVQGGELSAGDVLVLSPDASWGTGLPVVGDPVGAEPDASWGT